MVQKHFHPHLSDNTFSAVQLSLQCTDSGVVTLEKVDTFIVKMIIIWLGLGCNYNNYQKKSALAVT